MKFKAIKTGILAASFLMIIHQAAIGYAYFSGSSEPKNNPISLAKGEKEQKEAVSIIETKWDANKQADEQYALAMQPGQTAAKDPRVQSNVDYSCWVFITMYMPTVHAALEKANNPYPYVTFIGDETEYTNEFEMVIPEINDEDWVLYNKADWKNVNSYIYGYKVPLNAHEITTALFETVTVPEFSWCEGEENTISIRAQIIQTEGCPTLDDAAKKLGISSDIEWTSVCP